MIVGLAGIAGLMAVLIVAVKALGSGSKKVMKGATQLVILAIAVKLLASACNRYPNCLGAKWQEVWLA